MLQFRDRVWRPHMIFTANAECILATRIKSILKYGIAAKCLLMQAQRLFSYFEDTYTFDIRRCAFEVLIDQTII